MLSASVLVTMSRGLGTTAPNAPSVCLVLLGCCQNMILRAILNRLYSSFKSPSFQTLKQTMKFVTRGPPLSIMLIFFTEKPSHAYILQWKYVKYISRPFCINLTYKKRNLVKWIKFKKRAHIKPVKKYCNCITRAWVLSIARIKTIMILPKWQLKK